MGMRTVEHPETIRWPTGDGAIEEEGEDPIVAGVKTLGLKEVLMIEGLCLGVDVA